jgi:hypothetical protein
MSPPYWRISASRSCGTLETAVHHQVGVGDAAVDLLDAVDRQDVAGGLAGELVGAVAGADGDGQRVELRALDEVGGLLGVGQQLFARHRGVGAVAVFLVALHGLQRPQAAQFALDGDAQLVRHVDHLARDVDVVVVAGDGLAVGLQRAVHHHRAEAQVDGALAHVGALAVVLVHHQRDLRPGSTAAWIRCLMKARRRTCGHRHWPAG